MVGIDPNSDGLARAARLGVAPLRWLVDRVVRAEERQERLREAAEMPQVALGTRTLSNLEMISVSLIFPRGPASAGRGTRASVTPVIPCGASAATWRVTLENKSAFWLRG